MGDQPATEDISALAWVHGELRRSLETAHKALRRYLKEAEAASGSDVDAVDPAVLRTARSQLHQGVGALELVGLSAVADVLRASEAAVQRMVARPALVDAAAVATIERVSFALLDFLARQLAGKPVSPLALFPQYRSALLLAAADRIHPADLWKIDWAWRDLPPDASATPRNADDAARSEMETLVLALMRASSEPPPGRAAAPAGSSAAIPAVIPGAADGGSRDALSRMSDLCADLGAGARISAGHAGDAGQATAAQQAATFWQLAAAVFEAQAARLLSADVYVKRVASRLMAQLRMRVKGQDAISDRLAQDLLFFCSHAQAPQGRQAPRLAAVRQAWRLDALDALATADYDTPRLGRFDPALLALARKRLAAAKDSWSAVAGSEMHRLGGLAEQFVLVGESLQRLLPDGDVLARALQTAVAQTVAGGEAPPPGLAMEVATGLLYLDASLEDGEFDHPELGDRVQHLARRIDDVRIGAEPQPLDAWMEELYRRVSDRQTMGSVVQELRATLSEVEKQIDQYFRDPAQRALLIPVPAQLSAMRGVLSVLGLQQASAAALHMRDEVDALAQTEVDPARAIQAGTFDRLADNLGALSFLIDMLAVQPQLAKSLFRYDPETGNFSAVMGQSERVSAFAGFDDGAAAHGSPTATPAPSMPAVPTATATATATAAGTAPQLLDALQALAARAAQPSVSDADIAHQLEPLAQQAFAAERPDLARLLTAAQRTLAGGGDTEAGQAAGADDSSAAAARAEVRAELARAAAALAPPPAPELPPAAPTPPPVAVAPGATGLEDDAEMREIFVEEAREVIADAGAALERLADAPEHAGDMTAVRRAFHTLKGSARMVGLRPFGDAAWACEQLYNARLAQVPRVDAPLRQFSAEALAYLADWTDAIDAGRHGGHTAAAVADAADALRERGEPLPVALPPAAPGGTAAASGAVAAPQVADHVHRSAGAEGDAVLDNVPAPTAAAPMPTGDASAGPAPVSADLLELHFDPLPDEAAADAAGPGVDAGATLDGVALEPPVAAPADDASPEFDFDFPPLPETSAEPFAATAVLDTLQARVPGLPTAADLDFGLDFGSREASADAGGPAAATGGGSASEAAPTPAIAAGGARELDFELDLSDFDAPAQAAPDDASRGLYDLPLDAPAAAGSGEPAFLSEFAPPPAFPSAPADDAAGAHAALPAMEALEIDLAELDGVFDAPGRDTAGTALADLPELAGLPALASEPVTDPARPQSNGQPSPEAQAEPGPPLDEAETEPPTPPSAIAADDLRTRGAPDADADDQIKVIGPLRIGIPLFNIYLNEADELSRRLGTELAEWAHQQQHQHQQQPVPASSVALAHSLAGSSATVGYAELSALARALEHALDRAHAQGRGRDGEPELFNDVADEIRRLLHQFAAGFLRPVAPRLMERLADHERWPALEAPGDEAADKLDAAADAIDAELFPIFEEEADELLPQLHERLRDWADRPAEHDAAMACMRTLHTVKGGARLAGAMRLGELAHLLEARIEALAADAAGAAGAGAVRAPDIEPLLAQADAMSAEFERLCRAQHEIGQAPVAAPLPAPVSAPVPVPPQPPQPPVLAPVPTPPSADAMPPPEAAEPLAPAFGVEADSSPPAPDTPAPPAAAAADLLSSPPAEESVRGGAAAAPAPAPALTPALTPDVTPVIAQPQTEENGEAAATAGTAQPEPGADVGTAETAAPPAAAAATATTPAAQPAPATSAPAPAAAIDWRRFATPPAGAAAAADTAQPNAGAATGANAVVRVRAGLLDRLVNQAGEVSIARARIDSDVKQLQGALGELTDSLDRMRRQLRDIELQADTQISSRLEAAKATAAAFDPLEMDRFTRFQELTRFMAESVNDVATLQRSLQRTLQSTEDQLAAQARLTRELQDNLLRTRMVEFDSLADRLHRTARQAARDGGKQLRLEIVGGSIEVDRGVLERMAGSFEHLVRNSAAHGIESPEVRSNAGKDPGGVLTVSVAQAGNEVSVEFADDGAGLDFARIRRRGVERGLLAPDAEAGNDGNTNTSDSALAELIFQPGFSTADSVTELAGRGVGLDVVRAELNALGGRIQTRSEPGRGTRFTLLLPLTTAVTQVVMLRCGTLQVAVPSTLIEVVRRVPNAEVERGWREGRLASGSGGSGDDGNEAGSDGHQEGSLPFYWLPALLGSADIAARGAAETGGNADGRTQPVVLVRSAAQRVAVQVDEVLGNQEVVVKNVGPQLSRLPGLAGVTLLPSGAVALIYNPVALASLHGDTAHARMRQAAAVPATAADAADATSAAGMAAAVPLAERAPLVLVVDDSLTVRRVTQRLLVREGYRVATAKDGLDALERLAQERPAVLLSDIEMPRMDGFDLLRNVRADARLAGLPVVMITSRTAQKHRDHAVELGADHYLGKPYAEDELLALVARYAADGVPA